MRLLILASLFLTPLASAALAQNAAPALDAQQTLGRQLLNQHCAICHLKPQLGATTYGPPLGVESLGGDEAAMRQVIGEGTQRMPGFKYKFDAAGIDAIVAYIKTVAAPPAPAKQ